MNYSAHSFFAGQYEGILIVLQALHNLESEKEISREWVTNKLLQLGLDEFTNPILEIYFPTKEESN
jgi:hypothetical protein